VRFKREKNLLEVCGLGKKKLTQRWVVPEDFIGVAMAHWKSSYSGKTKILVRRLDAAANFSTQGNPGDRILCWGCCRRELAKFPRGRGRGRVRVSFKNDRHEEIGGHNSC